MIATLHLFQPLEQKLIDLLKSLSAADWNRPTVANMWTVKDVAAHLLDTSVRTVASAQHHVVEPPEPVNSYQDLVNYLNQLNADWVKAMRRVSTQTLIDFLQLTQKPMIDYYHSLDLQAPARFPVAWAGESESKNWFHIAREYTERWHHQQQIRDAVGQDGIMNREYFYPMMDTLMQALPHNYRTTNAPDGTCITIIITGTAGGTWIIQQQNTTWQFVGAAQQNVTTVTLTADTAWKLFTKALPAEEVNNRVKVSGQKELSEPLLKMVAVMG
jgi:uncharacterized protein (TIGR03083 family)